MDHNYFVCGLEHSDFQIFIGIVQKLVEDRRRAKKLSMKKSNQMVNVSADGRQSCSSAFGIEFP